MKRTKAREAGAIQYEKFGGGSFTMMVKGRLTHIKSGQRFWAKPADIPKAFADTVRAVNPEEEEALEGEKLETLVAAEFSIKHRNGAWYDVVDDQGKVVNEKALKEDEAKELLSSLT